MKIEDKEKISEICWAATSFVEKYQDSILPSDEWLEKRIEEFNNGTIYRDALCACFLKKDSQASGKNNSVFFIEFLKSHWLQEAALECVFTTLADDERSTVQKLFLLGGEILRNYREYNNGDISEFKKIQIGYNESEFKKCIALIHDQGIYDKLNPLFQQLVDEYSDSLFSEDFFGFPGISFYPRKAGDPNRCEGEVGCNIWS